MKLSVIVPIFNAQNYLKQYIPQILNQSFSDFELILINDGSSDLSLEILKEFEIKDNRIVLIDKQNEGICATRNLGKSIVKGEYIIFLDNDDEIASDMFEVLLNEITQNNCDMVISGYGVDYFNKNGTMINSENFEPESKVISIKDEIIISYLKNENNIMLPIWNKIYKRELIKDINFNVTFKLGMEDALFNSLVFSRANKIAFFNYIGYFYKVRDSQSTSQKLNKNIYEDMLVLTESVVKLYNSLSDKSDKNYYILNKYIFNVITFTLLNSILGKNVSYEDIENILIKSLSSEVIKKALYYIKTNNYSDLSTYEKLICNSILSNNYHRLYLIYNIKEIIKKGNIFRYVKRVLSNANK